MLRRLGDICRHRLHSTTRARRSYAAALEADVCEICTDVRGVFTADPRIVPDARLLPEISYEEMFELAALGAGVVAPRAVFLGMKFAVPIHVRHAMLPDTGTMIVQETSTMEQNEVPGVALKNGVGRVTMQDLPLGNGIQATIFDALADAPDARIQHFQLRPTPIDARNPLPKQVCYGTSDLPPFSWTRG